LTAPFDAIGRYYDLLYLDKEYDAEVAYVDGLLKIYGRKVQDLLEFGSGTGGHGRLLTQLGYKVTGIERSVQMLMRARAIDGFVCLQGDACTARLGRQFDAVIALFHVVSYQVRNKAVQALFARAAEHLRPGGLFIFDVWYSPAVNTQRPEVRVKRLMKDGLEITRIAEPIVYPNENRVDVCYTVFVREANSGDIQSFTETHPMRHFSLPELDLLIEAAGFERVCAQEWLTGKEPSEASWGVCLVLVKA
jgi:SAM-dependent methyltransferase